MVVVITPQSVSLIVTFSCDLLRFMGPMWLAAFPGVFLKPGNRQCLGYKWLADVLVFTVRQHAVSKKEMAWQCFVGYYCTQKINWIEHCNFLYTKWVIWSGNIILTKLWQLSNVNEKLFLYIYIPACLTWAHIIVRQLVMNDIIGNVTLTGELWDVFCEGFWRKLTSL